MYLHATDKVLKDDNLLALFDIPKILWPRLRLSWQRRRPHMITGRLDVCMDERGLKVYEYNADSASCHTEAGLIIERWAEQGYKGTGFNPAEGLINELAGAWKHSRARPFVHIMQDKDIEENYHAQFMEQALPNWLVPGNTVVHVRLSISCRTKISRKTITRSLWSRRCTRRALKRVSCVGWMNWAGMLPGN